MMQELLMPQLDDSDDFIYQQDGAPPHYHHLVLNQHLPQRWIGRTAANDQELLRWPPRSPDLTPRDFFFLWGYVGDEKVPEHGKYGSKDKHATRCWQTDAYHSNAEKLKILQIYA
jgi:hypothetical protein